MYGITERPRHRHEVMGPRFRDRYRVSIHAPRSRYLGNVLNRGSRSISGRTCSASD